MALTPIRWMMAALLGCALLTTGLVLPEAPRAHGLEESPEVLQLRRIQRRTFQAAQRFRSSARADSVRVSLPALEARDAHAPRIIVDRLLPQTHRLIAERGVERHWRLLHIDSALVPVTVAVVLDTAAAPAGAPNSRGGDVAFDYVLATGTEPAATQRCIVIVAIQAHQIARPGGQRSLAARFDQSRRGDALLGPCAYQARFGVAGPHIDAWLRERSYDLASSPRWVEPERETFPRRLAEDGNYTPAEIWKMLRWELSPEAQACAAGSLERCDSSLATSVGARGLDPASLVTRRSGADQHWGGLTRRYLSDLVSTIGPDRFGRFWRSPLPPNEALRAAAGMPVNAWTHQWAMSFVGEVRTGPALGGREVFGGALLASLCLAIAAWGWGRRQVR